MEGGGGWVFVLDVVELADWDWVRVWEEEVEEVLDGRGARCWGVRIRWWTYGSIKAWASALLRSTLASR